MSVLRGHQPHTMGWLERRSMEAAQIVGERLLAVELAGPSRVPEDNARCPVCYSDVYGSATSDQAGSVCPACLGTTWKTPIIRAAWTFGTIGEPERDTRPYHKQGEWEQQAALARIVWPASLRRNDLLIRVTEWDKPLTAGPLTPTAGEVWKVASTPRDEYLKDGAAYTGDRRVRVGSMMQVMLQPEGHPAWGHVPLVEGRVVGARAPYVWVPNRDQWVLGDTVQAVS